jgi:hypothetical protein
MGHHIAAVLNRDLALVVLKEDPVLIQLLDFAVNFPSWLISRMTFRWSVLRMICGSRLLPMNPPDTATEIRGDGPATGDLDAHGSRTRVTGESERFGARVRRGPANAVTGVLRRSGCGAKQSASVVQLEELVA